MKKLIVENNVVHEVVYITSPYSPKNLCRLKGEFTHDYKTVLDATGRKIKSCIRCGNMPVGTLLRVRD